MNVFEVLKRDGFARTGLYNIGERSTPTPAIIDPFEWFPGLSGETLSNIPLNADQEFAEVFMPMTGENPVRIVPSMAGRVKAGSGDCIMVPGWFTVIDDPVMAAEYLLKMKNAVPPDTAWYVPASALPSNICMLVYSGFDLFDFTAVDLMTSREIFCTTEGMLPADAMNAGLCGCEGCKNGDLFTHNRNALVHEMAKVRYAVRRSELRELYESRCRMSASQVGLLRILDRSSGEMERRTTVARSIPLCANSAESQNRCEITRFCERVVNRFVPSRTDVAVLLPCSARKPYSLSRSHHRFISTINGRAHEVIVTSPLGVVPRELEAVYPAGHYDVPVTGYWDREESEIIAGNLVAYLEKNDYNRVIAHLEGGALDVARMAAGRVGIDLETTCRDGRPLSHESLETLDHALEGSRKIGHDTLRGVASWQFGTLLDTSGMRVKGRTEKKVVRGRTQYFSIDSGSGLLRPTFEGWGLIPSGYRVYIDNFVPKGDILAPGVTRASGEIREGDEVLVLGEGAMTTGRAAMPGWEMETSSRGVAVRVRKVKKL